MPQIAIEYVILVPMLILQIFLFPLAASVIMNQWTTQSRTLALQDAAKDVGNSIQQLYFTLNQTALTTGSASTALNIPTFINNYPYSGNATLASSGSNPNKVLTVTLKLTTIGLTTTTLVPLGQNVVWKNSSFMSNSTNSAINATKTSDGIVTLSFMG